MNDNPHVFVSYASEDKERFVFGFAKRLRAKGIDAWFDTWEILPGDSLVDKIFNEGLKPADAVIVVLSNSSITKPWVQKELSIAITKNIVDKKRLIPVRLDHCEVPECLRDTLWQDIPDLENYEEQFEKIVNAIHGQYTKPPLGAAPAYVRPDILNIGDLTKIDSTIFEHACRMALQQGHAVVVSGERLTADMHDLGISEEQIMETQEVLEGRYYIKVLRVMGPPHVYDFGITTTGFDEFARVGIKDYARICADVGRILVRRVIQEHGQTSKHEIANELNQPLLVIEHILKVFQSRGLVEYAESMGGDLFMDVYRVSPELRRRLEGNG